MLSYLRRKWQLLTCTVLVSVLLGLSGIQVVNKQELGSRIGIGIGSEKVITLGDIAYAAGSVDYTFDGTDDNVQFQAAFNALPSTGGKLVVVSAVQINFSSTVTRAIPNVTIEGSGRGTYFTYNGSSPIFTAGGNNWKFVNLRTDAGSISMGSTTGWEWNNVTINTTYYTYRTPRATTTGASWEIPVGRGATYVVAASDAPAVWKSQADVLSYGTNDQTDISSLIADNVTIILSPGTFVFGNQMVTIRNDNVHIIGQGESTIIDFTASTTRGFWIDAAGAGKTLSDIVFEKIYLKGDSSTDLAIYFQGQSLAGFKVNRPKILNCRFETPKGATYYTYTVDGAFVDNFVVQSVSQQYDGVGIASSTGTKVVNNWFYDVGDDAISGYDAPETTIIGNHIYNSGDSGITLIEFTDALGHPGSIIKGNYIEGSAGAGTTPNEAGIQVASLTNKGKVIISGNTVLDGSKYGIVVQRANEVVVSGNIVRNNGYHGIYINQSSYVACVSNVVTGNSTASANTYSGIYVSGGGGLAASYNSVSSNTITGAGHKYAVEEVQGAQGANFNVIQGNVAQKEVSITGSGTLTKDNSLSFATTEKHELVSQIMNALQADVRGLWFMDALSGTSLTDYSLYGHTLTHTTAITGWATQPAYLAKGIYYTFGNSNNETLSLTDTNNKFTFGNGTTDQAFSVFALVKMGTNQTYTTIAGNYKGDTGKGWELLTANATYPTIWAFDHSAGADVYIGTQYQTTLGSTLWHFVVATYDGTGAATGFKLYVDGVVVADVDISAGAYVSMDDNNSPLYVGKRVSGGGAPAQLLNDAKIALLGATAGVLTGQDVWELNTILKQWYNY